MQSTPFYLFPLPKTFASIISGHTYSWTSSPSGFTSTSANPTVTPTVTTTYTLTETITSNSCSKTSSVTVTVKQTGVQINLKPHTHQAN